ncbi:MAG: sodium-translocating pyrophosphatase [Candidatus Omnitrophica bacterium]|nr:sodium-translocating pyrophosphatase [Candidatus Omnitrophota bacterium]
MDLWQILWVVRAGALLALATAAVLAWRILGRPEGTSAMIQVASWVREGAYAYLKQQYKVIFLVFLVLFVVLFSLTFVGLLPFFVPFALITGGFFSGSAGFLGMSVATRASARTAAAAEQSLNKGLQVAFSAGSVMGLTVVGLGLLDLSNWYTFLNWWYLSHPLPPGMTQDQVISSTMLCSCMGASTVALFARVGGGIFTKAAGVGADLVGKIEGSIPEDDPRNPATISDNVGDNVGDVAGMGADLYESYAASIVAAMALGLGAGLGTGGVVFPLVLASFGIAASVIGISAVRCGEETSQRVLLAALRKGVVTSAVIVLIGAYFLVRFFFGPEHQGIYGAVIAGLIAGLLIGFATEFYTSSEYKPTQRLAETALTGPATVIIGGVGVGMASTAIPVLLIGIAIFASFYLAGGGHSFELGLYGVGISAVGLLATLGMTLATDAYGPVADNAGGNAQMTGQPPHVRQRTDALDALGNTTAATGKGMAIAAAALTALALLVSYRDKVLSLGTTLNMSFINPRAIIGLFIGAMLPYLFSSMAMQAVGKAAGKVVEEVRRQWREIKGLMEGKAKADYGRCVGIVTQAAQKEMIAPSSLAIVAPVGLGLLLGPEAVLGLLAGSLVSGFVLAIMMANSGGAWDNAKKYIEAGQHGGKGSAPHKATVVGDTVGDPFKDTAGPSLNILLKLMAVVSIVFAGMVVKFQIF